MKCDKELPGFQMFNAFFSDLKGAFEPVACSNKEKREYVDALKTLPGSPAQEFRTLREDLDLTAKVREVRRYGKDKTFVRFEFKRLDSNCTWSRPFQFMGIFDDLKNLVSYTVMQERGLFKEGLKFYMTKVRYNWDQYEETEDPVVALTLLDSEDTPEVQVVDKATKRPIAFIYGGMGARECRFDIEWYVACEPWMLMIKNIGFDAVEKLVFALKDGGSRHLRTRQTGVRSIIEQVMRSTGCFSTSTKGFAACLNGPNVTRMPMSRRRYALSA